MNFGKKNFFFLFYSQRNTLLCLERAANQILQNLNCAPFYNKHRLFDQCSIDLVSELKAFFPYPVSESDEPSETEPNLTKVDSKNDIEWKDWNE